MAVNNDCLVFRSSVSFGGMNRWFILILLCFTACGGQNTLPETQKTELYTPPNWNNDTSVAAINSKLSSLNQAVLPEILRNIAAGELDSYETQIQRIDDLIELHQTNLARTTAEFTETSDPDLFMEYCGRLRIQIELLRIQKAHKEDLLKLSQSLRKLRDSIRVE